MKEEEFIAHIRHIAWISFQIAAGQPYNAEINEDQFQSLLDGVQFAKDHPNMTPEENHENWMREKMRQGWKFGDEKDFEKKTHPDLIPYNELPDIEKLKDTVDIIAHCKAEELWQILTNSLEKDWLEAEEEAAWSHL